MAREGTTRYYSTLQEESVRKLIGGHRNPNSGAGMFSKGDVLHEGASMLVECKTPTSEKDSFSIKKEWIDKNRKEARDMGMFNQAIAFTYEPGKENFFVVDEGLFRFLVEKLEEEYSTTD